jgi:ribulose-phosphate 3-epimerase
MAPPPWDRRDVRGGLPPPDLAFAARLAGRMPAVGKLSVSILSADLAHLADQVKVVEQHADLIHIDVMDAHFVPPLTIGPVVVRSLRPHTGLMLNCHLMVEDPANLFDDLVEAGANGVVPHIEAVRDPAPVLRKARDAGLSTGIAVSPETPVRDVFAFLEDVDEVIVMSVHPGWAGQSFIPESLPRIEEVRAEVERRGLSTDVEVDGGVKLDNARRCVEAGASVLTAASAIFQATDPAEAARALAEIARGA